MKRSVSRTEGKVYILSVNKLYLYNLDADCVCISTVSCNIVGWSLAPLKIIRTAFEMDRPKY